MKKILIAGYEEKTLNYVNAVKEIAGDSADIAVSLDISEADKADILILPGGGDIDPAFWGEEIAGSDEPDRELDRAQLEILKIFAEADKSVFGICRGMQLINVYFGGSLIQDIDTADIHRGDEHGDKYHTAKALKGTYLEEIYGESCTVNSSHHQAVKCTGEGIEVIMRAEDGIAEAVIHRDKPVYGVQFHPERMGFNHEVPPGTASGKRLMEYWLASAGVEV